MNLSTAKNTTGYFDFTRVESIEISSYTEGACPKLRQKVIMTMFSGKRHVWGVFVDAKGVAEAKRNNLLAAVIEARKGVSVG